MIGFIILGLYHYQDPQENLDQDAVKNVTLSAPEVVLDAKETQDPKIKEAPKEFTVAGNPKSKI